MNPCYYCEDMVNGKCCMTVKDEKIDAQSALLAQMAEVLEQARNQIVADHDGWLSRRPSEIVQKADATLDEYRRQQG